MYAHPGQGRGHTRGHGDRYDEGSGRTRPDAEARDRSTPTQQVITADTTITKLANLWLSYLRAEGRTEGTTIDEYERVLSGVVLPELGGLRLREATTSRIDLFLLRIRTRSVNRQRKAKVVLGAMIDMAVRHDALPVNPVRQTSRVTRTKTEPRSLTVADLATVRTAVRAWMTKDRPGPKPTSDMADIIDLMLATGGQNRRSPRTPLERHRPGRPEAEPHHQRDHQDRARQRHVPQGPPKSAAGLRTIVLPDFAGEALCRRRKSARAHPSDAVFPTRNGTWQQVNNVERRWRQIRQDTGLDWVTPHTFRKTVATLISERVSSETASQQLGHSSPAITREFYIAKPAIAADVAHVLQSSPTRSGPRTTRILGE